MPTITKVVQDEIHYTALVNYVNRGELYAAYSNEGTEVVVNWGSANGYPSGESFARIPRHHVKDLIAVLRALNHAQG